MRPSVTTTGVTPRCAAASSTKRHKSGSSVWCLLRAERGGRCRARRRHALRWPTSRHHRSPESGCLMRHSDADGGRGRKQAPHSMITIMTPSAVVTGGLMHPGCELAEVKPLRLCPHLVMHPVGCWSVAASSISQPGSVSELVGSPSRNGEMPRQTESIGRRQRLNATQLPMVGRARPRQQPHAAIEMVLQRRRHRRHQDRLGAAGINAITKRCVRSHGDLSSLTAL